MLARSCYLLESRSSREAPCPSFTLVTDSAALAAPRSRLSGLRFATRSEPGWGATGPGLGATLERVSGRKRRE
eukprot:3634966-Pyramimonas_sp.AAC.1